MATLPPKASIRFLRKEAKRRFRVMKHQAPDSQLADAQYALAREYGFASWSRLKSAVDRQAADRWTARLTAQAAFVIHPSRQALWLGRQERLIDDEEELAPLQLLQTAGLYLGLLLLLLTAVVMAAPKG